MIRYLRYGFLITLGVVLIAIALANREPVRLRLMTDDLAAATGLQAAVSLPLFIVIFASIVAGVLIGFVWEWFREHKHRADAARQRRERQRLEAEMGRLKTSGEAGKDDILALVDG